MARFFLARPCSVPWFTGQQGQEVVGRTVHGVGVPILPDSCSIPEASAPPWALRPQVCEMNAVTSRFCAVTQNEAQIGSSVWKGVGDLPPEHTPGLQRILPAPLGTWPLLQSQHHLPTASGSHHPQGGKGLLGRVLEG